MCSTEFRRGWGGVWVLGSLLFGCGSSGPKFHSAYDVGVHVTADETSSWYILRASDRTYRFAMPGVPEVGQYPVIVGDEELEATVYRYQGTAPFRRYVLSVLNIADSDAEETSLSEILDLGQAQAAVVFEGQVVKTEALPPFGRIRQVLLEWPEGGDHYAVAWIQVIGTRVFTQVGWQSKAEPGRLPSEVQRFFAYLQVFQSG